MKPNSQLIDITEWADLAHSLIGHYLSLSMHLPYETVHQFWTWNHSLQWVRHRIDDNFNQCMEWSKSTNAADNYLTRTLYDDIGLAADEGWMDELYVRIDFLEMEISNWVSSITHLNTWYVWSLQFNDSFCCAEYRGDYRAYVYEQIRSNPEALAMLTPDVQALFH